MDGRTCCEVSEKSNALFCFLIEYSSSYIHLVSPGKHLTKLFNRPSFLDET